MGITDKIACVLGFPEQEQIDEMVESVHMLLFFVMVLFIVFVFLMVQMGRFLGKEWRRNEGFFFVFFFSFISFSSSLSHLSPFLWTELCRRPKVLATKANQAVQELNNRGFGMHVFTPLSFDPPARAEAV